MTRTMAQVHGVRGLVLCLLASSATPAATTRLAGFRSRLGNKFGTQTNRTNTTPGAETGSASQHQGWESLGSLRANRSFSGSPEHKHRLRICNAYPSRGSIDVFHCDIKLTDKPLKYRECREFVSPVEVGDKLKFEVDGVRAGHFGVSDLPEGDAVLVLVVLRRDSTTEAVAFESHVFANLINAQIAVLDAYRGPSAAGTTPSIRDPSGTKRGGARSEALHYDSVVAVNPGVYEVVLQGSNGRVKTKQELVALNRESYIVVRCGAEPHVGPVYPQELIVFPHSEAKVLTGSGTTWGSGAPRPCGASILFAGLFLASATLATVPHS